MGHGISTTVTGEKLGVEEGASGEMSQNSEASFVPYRFLIPGAPNRGITSALIDWLRGSYVVVAQPVGARRRFIYSTLCCVHNTVMEATSL